MGFSSPLVIDPFRNLTHQFVVVDPVEEFLQIKNQPSSCSRLVARASGR